MSNAPQIECGNGSLELDGEMQLYQAGLGGVRLGPVCCMYVCE